jgi:subtilisin family serine protease
MMRHLIILCRRLFRSSRLPVGVALVLAALALATLAGAQVQRGVRPQTKIAPGQIIVWAQPGTDPAAVRALADGAGCDVKRPLAMPDVYLLQVRSANNAPVPDDKTLQAVAALKATGKLRFAGPNKILPFLDVPNDPRYPEQWHLPLMNMPQAWDLQKSTANVIIMDLDSGCDITHPDLKDRIIGYHNYDDGSNDVTDNVPHGTHTAGSAAASTGNGIGVAGVAWGSAGLYIAKGGDFGVSLSAVIDALMYARQTLNQGGNRVVVNCSFGGEDASDTPDPNDPFNRAFLDAAAEGIVFSISAGNSFDQGNPPINPANLAQLSPNIFCVASVGPQKEHSFYSSSRSYTTIAAPGGDDPSFSDNTRQILSTFPVSGGSYGFEQGTSMAAPQITGVVALLMSAGLPPDQCKSVLTVTADPVGRPVPNSDYGWGVVDTNAALLRVISGISIQSPASGAYVYGPVSVVLKVGDPTKFAKASLTIDGDTTVIATTTSAPYTLAWDSQATDATGAPKYPNGNHTLRVLVDTPQGKQLNLSVAVKLDNPIAAITSPADNGFITKTVSITGTADGLRKPFYTLEYATAAAPTTWTVISNLSDINTKIQNGLLGTWDLNTPSVVADGAVTLRLRVHNPDGFEVSATHSLMVDQTPPNIPANFKGTPGHQQVSLAWDASTDPSPGKLAGYNLYRSEQSLTGYARLNTALVSAPDYTDPNLINGKTYFYKVTAVDAAGNESAPTQSLSVTPNRNGTASGQIVALSGAFLPDATVTLLQNGAPVGTVQPVKTDSSGQYSFPAPPGFDPGTYDLKVEMTGYVPQLIKNITVDLGKDALNQNAALQPQPQFPAGWSIFTLPYDFQGADLTSVLTTGGAPVDARYYNPATGTYLRPTDAGFPKPAPGIGYWLNASGTPSVTLPGVPNTEKIADQVPIRKGWNLVGNPYQDPIRWALNNLTIQVTDPADPDNGKQASLDASVGLGWSLDFAWGGANGRTLFYDRSVIPNMPDTIPGYGAFWFFSNKNGTLSIAPPSVVGRAAPTTGTDRWTAQITATSGGKTASAWFGLSGSRRQFPAPPDIAPGLSLTFSADGRSAATGGIVVDLRSGTAGTQTWDITLESAGDQPVTLTWPTAARIPRGWNAALVDTATGQRVNMRASSGLTLAPSRAPRRLQVEVSRATMAERMFIRDLTVNTTRSPAPAIGFTLTQEGQMTVTILKANGDTIRLLTNRSAKAGSTSLLWDGKDSAGRSVPPGVYLVQVRAVGAKGDVARAVLPFLINR